MDNRSQGQESLDSSSLVRADRTTSEEGVIRSRRERVGKWVAKTWGLLQPGVKETYSRGASVIRSPVDFLQLLKNAIPALFVQHGSGCHCQLHMSLAQLF